MWEIGKIWRERVINGDCKSIHDTEIYKNSCKPNKYVVTSYEVPTDPYIGLQDEKHADQYDDGMTVKRTANNHV